MNVSNIWALCLVLSLVLLLPLLFSLLFPVFFSVHDARLNDCFFKLRYCLAGSTPISPYLSLFFFDDRLATTPEYTGSWNTIINKLENTQYNPGIKTLLLYPGPGFSCEELNARDTIGKLFLPGWILNQKSGENPADYNRLRNEISFIPEVQYRGCPGTVEEAALSFPGEGAGTAPGTGIANLFPDADGIIRRLPLFFQSGEGYYYPSLFLAALCHYCEVKPGTIEIGYRKVRLPRARFRMTVRDIVIPVDEKGHMCINVPGPKDASFDLLSAARLMECEGVQEHFLPLRLGPVRPGSPDLVRQEPGLSPPGSLILVGDISTWGGKFSTGIYDTVYPDVMILASAFNTVLTDTFIKPAGFIEIFFLYIPILILLNFFLIMSEKKTLFFFIIGLPILLLLSLVLVVCMQLFLFLFSHSLPGILPLVTGILLVLFLLLLFRLLRLMKQLMPEEVDEEGDDDDTKGEDEKPKEEILIEIDNFNLIDFFGKDNIENALNELRFEPDQVKITLLILEGLTNKEIGDKLTMSEDETVKENAVAQRIRKIYGKCNIKTKPAHTRRPDFIIRIIKFFILKHMKKD
jgi:hypothetical protein